MLGHGETDQFFATVSLPRKLIFFLPAFVLLSLGRDLVTDDLFLNFCLSRPILDFMLVPGQSE
jgi:hypothetical protein